MSARKGSVEREIAVNGNGDQRKQVVVRLDTGLLRRIDMLGVQWDCFRSEAIDRVLRLGLEQAEQQQAAWT